MVIVRVCLCVWCLCASVVHSMNCFVSTNLQITFAFLEYCKCIAARHIELTVYRAQIIGFIVVLWEIYGTYTARTLTATNLSMQCTSQVSSMHGKVIYGFTPRSWSHVMEHAHKSLSGAIWLRILYDNGSNITKRFLHIRDTMLAENVASSPFTLPPLIYAIRTCTLKAADRLDCTRTVFAVDLIHNLSIYSVVARPTDSRGFASEPCMTKKEKGGLPFPCILPRSRQFACRSSDSRKKLELSTHRVCLLYNKLILNLLVYMWAHSPVVFSLPIGLPTSWMSRFEPRQEQRFFCLLKTAAKWDDSILWHIVNAI